MPSGSSVGEANEEWPGTRRFYSLLSTLKKTRASHAEISCLVVCGRLGRLRRHTVPAPARGVIPLRVGATLAVARTAQRAVPTHAMMVFETFRLAGRPRGYAPTSNGESTSRRTYAASAHSRAASGWPRQHTRAQLQAAQSSEPLEPVSVSVPVSVLSVSVSSSSSVSSVEVSSSSSSSEDSVESEISSSRPFR